MLDFDTEGTIQDFLSDDEPELTDKRWRFKSRVNQLMKRHNLTRSDAENVVETVVRTKETDKRCKCGAVAQYFDKETKDIFCGICWVGQDRDPLTGEVTADYSDLDYLE